MPMPFSYGDMPKILMFGCNSPTKQPYLAQFPVDIKLEPSQSYFCDSPKQNDANSKRALLRRLKVHFLK